MSKVIEVRTHLTADQVNARVAEVNEYERFAALKFSYLTGVTDPETNLLKVTNAEMILVTTKDEAVFTGHVEDWDDSHYYVNLD